MYVSSVGFRLQRCRRGTTQKLLVVVQGRQSMYDIQVESYDKGALVWVVQIGNTGTYYGTPITWTGSAELTTTIEGTQRPNGVDNKRGLRPYCVCKQLPLSDTLVPNKECCATAD
jgi:hypothetical protein